jgi:hypothetical protein
LISLSGLAALDLFSCSVAQPLAIEEFSLQLRFCLLYRSTALDEVEPDASDAKKMPDPQAENISI